MAYNPAIPASTDDLSVSQGQIRDNFTALSTFLNINHVDFASGDQGKHKWVTFPRQTSNPPIVFGADELALYSFQSTVTGVSELFLNKQNDITVVQVPISASIMSTDSAPANNSAGWTYLPSGILLKWGNGSANGHTIVAFPVAADIPVFTQVFSIQITTYAASATDTNTFVRLENFVNIGFNCYGSARTTTGAAPATFQYLAIGY